MENGRSGDVNSIGFLTQKNDVLVLADFLPIFADFCRLFSCVDFSFGDFWWTTLRGGRSYFVASFDVVFISVFVIVVAFVGFSLSLFLSLSLCRALSPFLFPPSLSLSLHSPCRDSSPRDSFRDSSGDSCRATRSFFSPSSSSSSSSSSSFPPPIFPGIATSIFGAYKSTLSLSLSSPAPPPRPLIRVSDSSGIPEGFPKDSRRILEGFLKHHVPCPDEAFGESTGTGFFHCIFMFSFWVKFLTCG